MKQRPEIPKTKLPSGAWVPILGQGTWRMGENSLQYATEVAALRQGIDLGMTLIDTAEMYGEGGAEKVVGEAIRGQREKIFLVSKFYPHHASRSGVVRACEESLKRLQTEHLDLYLLHWRGTTPLAETLEGLTTLQKAGKIRDWGVSNFDIADMNELVETPAGNAVATNQVLYNLLHRGISWDLLPWCQQRSIPIMAYSPFEQGGLRHHPALAKVAKRHGVGETQIALAWLLQQKGVIVIPKSGNTAHLHQNRQAIDIVLNDADLNDLDTAFPPPKGPGALATR